VTIECYYGKCKYHADDGPFCDEEDCRATKEELEVYGKSRAEYLKGLQKEDKR